jgi:class 3 adenylate cyclase/tetratricopeptide (TPR) repeat protein
MTCPRCHAENRDGLRFCEDCGSRLTLTCAQCGGELAPGKRFCGSCGAPAAGEPTARTASPESYTPKYLAEKILTSKAVEGERKQVTVLFADLKGSMELLADRDPEDARRLLDPVLEHMMEAVHRYEGTVNQVMGDGIMALFGAPVAHEDHAVRGCYAALDMQAALRRYAEEIRRAHGVDVQVRVGLNSGEVVVRAIGSDLRMDYSAVGQTTHLAARMEQLARPGATLLTADTLRLSEGYIEVTPLGRVPLKGLADPIEVYELVGLGLVRSRLGVAAARGLTRFVGRDAELEQLRQALGHAAAGHGQVVAIVGEPGVGKSRLVWEITHSHRTHGWLVLHAGSVSYGKATPYLPVIDLVKRYFRIEERDDHRTVREKVTGKILTLDRSLERALPALLTLLDMPSEDPEWETLDPAQRRQRILDAVISLLRRESQVQPLLVVFEDLHWIDGETQVLLDRLVERLPATRVLLLVNYRPEYEHRWGSKTYYTQLRLDPLPVEGAEALLTALLGGDPQLESIKRLLIERTDGNPFFLEETVRTLVETRILEGERGAYHLATTPATIQVPATVQSVLAARIDRLPSEEKQLLQSAAVIGKDVPLALLLTIVEQDEASVRRSLAHLQAAEFVYERRLCPDLEYTFKHALTHEVAYGSLLQDRRRALHARILAAIERLHRDRLAEHVDRMAYHALRAELNEKAVTYFRQAGAKAMSRCAYRETVVCLEQALAALGPVQDTRESLELAIDLRFELRYPLTPLLEYRRAVDCLREAEALAMKVGDQHRLGWIFMNLAVPLDAVGEREQAMEVSRRAIAIAVDLGDVPLQAEGHFNAAHIHFDRGEYRRAIDLLRWSVGALQGDLIRFGTPGVASVLCRTWLAWPHAALGEYPDAVSTAEDGVRIAEEIGQPYNRINAYLSVGWVCLHKGEFPEAVSRIEEALALYRTSQIEAFRIWVVASLGLALARTGRTIDALRLAGEASGRLAGLDRSEAAAGIWLGEIHLSAGFPDEARRLVSMALEIVRQGRERGREAEASCLLGAIALAAHPPDLATSEAHYGHALQLATELEMRPLVAHCHLGLGTL